MRLHVAIGSLVILMSTAGCVARKTPLGPRVNERRARNLRSVASAETGCTKEPMVYSHVGGNTHRMEGCGVRADYLLFCEGYCGWGSVTKLRKRAAFDFGCDETQLATQELSEGTYGVSGCGQRGGYVLRHLSWGQMEWVLNSVAEPAGGPPQQ